MHNWQQHVCGQEFPNWKFQDRTDTNEPWECHWDQRSHNFIYASSLGSLKGWLIIACTDHGDNTVYVFITMSLSVNHWVWMLWHTVVKDAFYIAHKDTSPVLLPMVPLTFFDIKGMRKICGIRVNAVHTAVVIEINIWTRLIRLIRDSCRWAPWDQCKIQRCSQHLTSQSITCSRAEWNMDNSGPLHFHVC